MPRYVIEMDEPRDCGQCPCLSESYAGALCRLVVDEFGIRGRPLHESEPYVYPVPEWCPLVRAD